MTKADWQTGRLKKKFEETALLGQKWLKDEDKTVQEVLKDRYGEMTRRLFIGIGQFIPQGLRVRGC